MQAAVCPSTCLPALATSCQQQDLLRLQADQQLQQRCLLQALLNKPQALFGLVLSPTRELAIQISEQFEALGAGIGVKCAVLVGGVDMMAQTIALGKRPHIIVGTPGRVVDHLSNTKVRILLLLQAVGGLRCLLLLLLVATGPCQAQDCSWCCPSSVLTAPDSQSAVWRYCSRVFFEGVHLACHGEPSTGAAGVQPEDAEAPGAR